MELITFLLNSILLGVALAIDAFSVSVANGIHEPQMRAGKKRKIAGVFAGFQMGMPLLGWFFVRTLVSLIKGLEAWIPWIASGILFFIGGKMLLDAVRDRGEQPEEESTYRLGKTTLLFQGIATSLDALSVGFTIAEYGVLSALAAACIIGAVTYIICRIGLGLGVKVGTRYNRQAAILGGVILIAIAIEILLKHLLG